MKFIYPAAFYPLEGEPGYCVEVPDLPGCTTQGKSLEEAIEMAVDAASGWILTELESNKLPPKASKPNEIQTDDDIAFVSLILLDMDKYEEKYGQRAVRKNCTIPAWLNTMAEKSNVNFSAVLQSALLEKLGLNA